MIRRWTKKDWILLIICIIGLSSVVILYGMRIRVRALDYDTKLNAAKRMKDCMLVIKRERLRRGIELAILDINNTGLIGDEISDITTTLGSIEAKRTSTNPNFAAVVVDMLNEIGLEEGDCIAVNFSSSFPALDIAVLCAIEELNLKPIIINSIGSSTYGANIVDYPYFEMEELLYNNGLLSNKSIALSLGGAGDNGNDFYNDAKKIMIDKIESSNKQLIYEEDLLRNLEIRMKLYKTNKKLKAFVNVGGNLVAMGKGRQSYDIPHGILTKPISSYSRDDGLINKFLLEDIGVVHLLNIKGIANNYGLPIDPSYMPTPGEGDVFFKYRYNKYLAIAALLIIVIALTRLSREIR